MGTLTREEMEQAINDGGSVVIGQHIHTAHATLPTAADLAGGDAEKTAAARAALQAQRDALDAQLSKIDTGATATEAATGDEKPKRGRAAKDTAERDSSDGDEKPADPENPPPTPPEA